MGDEVGKNSIGELTGWIASLSASQHQLTQSALDLQALAQGRKRQIKATLERAEELGDIMDIFICCLEDEAKQCRSHWKERCKDEPAENCEG